MADDAKDSCNITYKFDVIRQKYYEIIESEKTTIGVAK